MFTVRFLSKGHRYKVTRVPSTRSHTLETLETTQNLSHKRITRGTSCSSGRAGSICGTESASCLGSGIDRTGRAGSICGTESVRIRSRYRSCSCCLRVSGVGEFLEFPLGDCLVLFFEVVVDLRGLRDHYGISKTLSLHLEDHMFFRIWKIAISLNQPTTLTLGSTTRLLMLSSRNVSFQAHRIREAKIIITNSCAVVVGFLCLIPSHRIRCVANPFLRC